MSAPNHREMLILNAVVGTELEIRSDGSIWRVANKFWWRNGVIPCTPRRAEGNTMKGYLSIAAYWGGKQFRCCAHRLVWVHRFGKIPDGLTVNHKNGIKTDNRIDNLELATVAENTTHAMTCLPRRNYQSGERHSHHKLSESDVLKLRDMRKRGASIPYLEKLFGIARGQVSQICNGKVWGHLGLDKIRMDCRRRGESNNKSKLSTEKVIAIRNLHSTGVSFKALARQFGISDQAISNVVKLKTWAHV